MWCERKKTKCENINQPRIRLKNEKGRGSQPLRHGSYIPQTEKVRPCIYHVCVCIYHTQKFYGGISRNPAAPSLFGWGVDWENGVACVLVEMKVGKSCPSDSAADLRGHKCDLRFSRRRKRKRPITPSRKRLERLGVWGESELSQYSQASIDQNSSD